MPFKERFRRIFGRGNHRSTERLAIGTGADQGPHVGVGAGELVAPRTLANMDETIPTLGQSMRTTSTEVPSSSVYTRFGAGGTKEEGNAFHLSPVRGGLVVAKRDDRNLFDPHRVEENVPRIEESARVGRDLLESHGGGG